MKTARELRAERSQILQEARNLVEKAEAENRDFTPEEQAEYDGKIAQAGTIGKRVERLESLPGDLPTVPAINRTGLGDDVVKALGHYFRTGDTGGVRSMLNHQDEADNRGRPEVELRIPSHYEKRATDEIMNVAADGDGKSAIPVGFVNQIAARRAEVSLVDQLGCQLVPGRGTTVNYPYENADAVVFAATSEQVDALSNTFERDRPTLATKAFTLAKKTKKVELTEELLDDEDANLLGFLADHIGRAQGLTLNTLMLTEAAATGTSVSIGTTSAISAGDPEKFPYHATTGFYLDDAGSVAWVMRPPTFGAIKNLTGNSRLYDDQTGRGGLRTLLEYPVYYSSAAAAIGSGTISLYFGNWRFMGYRLDPALRFIRDPYTTDGVVILKYSFRTVFGLLIAGALDYGKHPTT